MSRSFLLGVLLLSSPIGSAQISFGGRPIALGSDVSLVRHESVVTFPAVDVERLLEEDELRASSGVKGPLRFGVNHDTDLSTDNSGTWTSTVDGTDVWRIELHCPGAKSINLVLGDLTIPDGARVFIWNEHDEVLGAFTQGSSGGRHSLGVAPLRGERLTVQYEVPAGMADHGSLRITQVTHGYRGTWSDRDLGDSGACNNNTICPEGEPWRDQIASVAMVIANGNGWCTGQLVNNCANDGTPYFLTANHCLSGQDPANWTFRFSWESPTCDPTAAGPTGNTLSGATLLENDPASDVALLLLNTAPPASYGPFYTGWDATGETPAATTVIHHPTGDVKKISFDVDAPVLGSFDGADCWHILDWDDGTTEGGSSGGGLWNPSGRLIGQLFGGQASCSSNVNDYFGRFDLSHPLLTQWLGTCGTPVIDGYDPDLPPSALDASLLTIGGIDANYCDEGIISPQVTVRNNGTSTLTALTIHYDLDNGTPSTFDWIGSLVTGSTTTIQLPDIAATSGVHVFHASCTSPNGGVDGQPSNDQQSRTFHVADPGEIITLTINTDNYGSETTWQLTAAGATLYTGGPYSDVNGGTTETAQFCLEESCFSFTIRDDVGDGICCGWGAGDYTITDSDGDVLLDGDGNFGSVASTTFCTGTASIIETDATRLLIFPDPSDGHIDLALPITGGQASIIVLDQLGRSVHNASMRVGARTALDLSHLAIGRYVIEVTTVDERSRGSISIAR